MLKNIRYSLASLTLAFFSSCTVHGYIWELRDPRLAGTPETKCETTEKKELEGRLAEIEECKVTFDKALLVNLYHDYYHFNPKRESKPYMQCSDPYGENICRRLDNSK